MDLLEYYFVCGIVVACGVISLGGRAGGREYFRHMLSVGEGVKAHVSVHERGG